MLIQLLLRNIALVDELSLSFEQGLNVLSGETGAGKSIIIDAVNFLLGARADKDIIRSGESRAYVEGCFDIRENQAAQAYLQEMALDDQDGLLVLSREIQQSGRSISRIGGVSVNLTQLRGLSALLIDIHGQHDHQSLLDERHHLGYLDDFGDEEHQHMLQLVEQAYEDYSRLESSLRHSLQQQATRQERMEELARKVKDIAQAKVEAGEEEQLKARLEQLRNAGRIQRGLDAAYGAAYQGEHDVPAALSLLQQAKQALDDIAAYGDAFEKARDRVDSLYYELEDLGLELREMRHSLDADEHSLQAVAERMDLLRRLSRRYGLPVDELPQALAQGEEELAALGRLEEDIAQLEVTRDEALRAYMQKADQLSQARQALAQRLSQRMEQQLEALNMAGTRFELQFEQAQRPGPKGLDDVRMLIAPNLGEEARPLSKIASGGETSRLMLALKSVSAEHNLIPAMIFDEIDAGISGRTAQVVAEKLWDIAQYRQVLCVTHLQQIAAMASTHFLVEKQEQGGRTQTLVHSIDGSARVHELSRIISGFGENSASSLAHAEHMLQAAREYRQTRAGKGKNLPLS